MANKISLKDILSEFEGDIDEFIDVLEQIKEDEGEEISNGKNPLEKSDDEEEKEVSDGEAAPANAPPPTILPTAASPAPIAVKTAILYFLYVSCFYRFITFTFK